MKTLALHEAILITCPATILYLTNFHGSDENSHDAYLLLTRAQSYLLTNSLYLEQAHAISTKNTVRQRIGPLDVIHISRTVSLSKQIRTLGNKHKIHTVRFEEHELTYAEYKKLRQGIGRIALRPLDDRFETLRSQKTNTELRAIRKAAKLTDRCFDFICKKIHIGMNEQALQSLIQLFFIRHNGKPAFTPIVAFGKHSSQPHYVIQHGGPDTKLCKNDVVLIDMGAKVNGYCSDMTRILSIGKPNPEVLRAYNTVRLAQEHVIGALTSYGRNIYDKKRHAFSGAQLDRLAKRIIRSKGYSPFSHSLGHSLGLEIHENPRLTVKKPAWITPTMVFTIEPGIYLPGNFGIRIEDTVYLSENGLEILTKSSKELVII